MAFTQPCFIRKKTQELIDKLLAMGYHHPMKYHEIFPNLLTVPYRGHNWGTLIAVSDKEIDLALKTQINQNSTIDCGDNEELFLALAALRDDIDKNQYFICTETYTDGFDITHDKGYFAKCITDNISSFQKYWRKATVEELIEHFNL